MMQRILSLYDWQLVKAGDGVKIETTVEGQRAVRLRVNSPSPASLYIKQADIVDDIFLARVEGLDEIQFNVLGDYELFVVGGDVWIDTLDGSRPDVEPVEPESFTRIVERQARNPELEIMERRMAENMERRMAAMAHSIELQRQSMEAELVAARTAAAAASAPAPEQNAGQVPSDPPAQPAAGGEGGEPSAV